MTVAPKPDEATIDPNGNSTIGEGTARSAIV
jgi:hypothetical protein